MSKLKTWGLHEVTASASLILAEGDLGLLVTNFTAGMQHLEAVLDLKWAFWESAPWAFCRVVHDAPH